jgi:hypothetical protein
MKRIILDHLRRWWLVWIAIGTFNYFIPLDDNKGMNYISLPMLLWLSAFALNFDLQRGSGRVLTTLPVSSRRIGRAWWILSVALPTLFLATISGLAILIHSAGTANGFPVNSFVVTTTTYALYFGSVFYLLIGLSSGQPQNAVAWLRMVFVFGFMIGIYFVKPTFETPQGIFFLLAAATLTVAGWFRAERMVLQRAGFRLVAKTPNKNIGHHKIPQGFGGLPYLVQRAFIKITLILLGVIIWMNVFMSFGHLGSMNAHDFVQQIDLGITSSIFFVVMFSIVPLVFQLRFLRTLPISPSALAATFVFLPVISIVAVGAIVSTVASLMLGASVILPATDSFLMFAAKAVVIVPLIVWRGLDVLNYLFIFLLIVSGSLVSLGMTIIFHLTKTPEYPLWVSLVIFLLCAGASFALTQRLLIKNSSAYRVRTMPNGWSMIRR